MSEEGLPATVTVTPQLETGVGALSSPDTLSSCPSTVTLCSAPWGLGQPPTCVGVNPADQSDPQGSRAPRGQRRDTRQLWALAVPRVPGKPPSESGVECGSHCGCVVTKRSG